LTRSGERVRPDHLLAAKAPHAALQRTAGSFSAALGAANEGPMDTTVLSVRGEIGLETTPMLLELLLPVLDHGTGAVVMDLPDVPFMDSSGVHFLVDTFRRLKGQSRRLAIACRERGQVHKLLALVGLLDALPVHGSRESALTDEDAPVRL
jgi:anti-sigma B factor antagonist